MHSQPLKCSLDESLGEDQVLIRQYVTRRLRVIDLQVWPRPYRLLDLGWRKWV